MKSKAFAVLCIGASLLVLLGAVSGVAASPLPRSPKGTSDITAVAAGTQCLTIPAAAFTSFYAGYDYENHGRYLKHLHSPGGGVDNGWYLAPVHLPHGAVVTKMTFYYYDESADEGGFANLVRFDLTNADDYPYMTTLASAGSLGWGAVFSTTIDIPIVDNAQYGYWAYLDLPDLSAGHIAGCGLVIEYGYRVYLPSVLRQAP
jgi:hypothetical protein